MIHGKKKKNYTKDKKRKKRKKEDKLKKEEVIHLREKDGCKEFM